MHYSNFMHQKDKVGVIIRYPNLMINQKTDNNLLVVIINNQFYLNHLGKTLFKAFVLEFTCSFS
jgi:hypothetical protein